MSKIGYAVIIERFERLYTNKYKDEDKICYPCPSAKYHPNGTNGSLKSYFNKCYPFFR
jgi:hypothetical protein